MQTTVHCQCSEVFRFPITDAGQSFKCGNCGRLLVVPNANPSLSTAPAGAAAPPPKPIVTQLPNKRSGCLTPFLVTLVTLTVCLGFAYVTYLKIKSGIEQATNQLSGWAGLVQGIDQIADIDEIIQGYEDNGYERVEGQIIVETTTIDSKRVYTCQVLEVNADVNRDIAILAQAATIQGTVNGNVDFMGQALMIESDAVITGNVNSRFAQLITVKGMIEGELSGGYQVLDAKPSRIKGGTTGTKDAIAAVGSTIDEVKILAEEIERQRQQQEADIRALNDDVEEVVLRLQRERTSFRRGEILAQLAQVTPTAEDRDTVAKLTIPHLLHHSTNDKAIQVFKVWATKDHAPLLTEALRNDRRDVASTEILGLLIELDARDDVVSFINHHDSSVARQAFEQVKAWNIDSTTIVRQCLVDINTTQSLDLRSRRRPLVILESIETFDDSVKHEVSQAIIPLLGNTLSLYESTLYNILQRTVTAADADLLIEHQPRTPENEYFELLAATQQPAAYKHIVDQAIIRQNRYALNAVKNTVKQDAEQYVWSHLSNRSFITRNQAIDVLGEIGTADSIEPLRGYLTDTMSKSSSQLALKKIQSRVAEN